MTPVAFIIFNRPEVTAQVFAAIRAARPKKLLVIADGPRADRVGEAVRCAAARAIVDNGVDWPCEVFRNYSDVNLGCGRRVSSGISWAFEQVDRAIILEDDCLPGASFFGYCTELLERYRDDERVMHIGANNFQEGQRRGPASYFFSRDGRLCGLRRRGRHERVLPESFGAGVLVRLFRPNVPWADRHVGLSMDLYLLVEQRSGGVSAGESGDQPGIRPGGDPHEA